MQGCGICEYGYGNCAGCPNCNESIPKAECSICHEGIYAGEYYVENDNEQLAHWDCLCNHNDFEKFLDVEVKEMEDDE